MITAVRRIVLIVFSTMIPALAPALENIEVPPGFRIEEYASVPNARSLALGDEGTVFVSNRNGSSVYAVVADGSGTQTLELISGLRSPNGIAFFEGDLYVAEIDRVTRYDDIESNLENVPRATELAIDLPSDRHHGWRYIGFSPEGKLHISIGAPCNICDEDGYARIVRMNPDGSDREVVAYGVRNSVGLTWHPESGDLWFTDNGRDMLGDDLPPDEVNHLSEVGQHFGYPYCHAGYVVDPKLGQGKSCADYRSPVQKMGAHVASLGLKFYTGDMFPPEYKNQLLVAEHGSWNRSKKAGYRVTLIRLDESKAVAYEPFATGWLQGESVSGRPVDLLVLPDGSVLLSDDRADKLYRITYGESDR